MYRNKRICLKCQKKFTAKSRFNKICPKCHEKNDRVHEIQIVKVGTYGYQYLGEEPD